MIKVSSTHTETYTQIYRQGDEGTDRQTDRQKTADGRSYISPRHRVSRSNVSPKHLPDLSRFPIYSYDLALALNERAYVIRCRGVISLPRGCLIYLPFWFSSLFSFPPLCRLPMSLLIRLSNRQTYWICVHRFLVRDSVSEHGRSPRLRKS